MPVGDVVFDGHTTVFGMDADTDATELPVNVVSKSVNRIFRGGKNRTRPPFREVELIFRNDEDRLHFRFSNLQGVSEYVKNRPGRRSGVVIHIGGRIYFGSLVNEKMYIDLIFNGNSVAVMHAFFCQAEEWIYIQDGVNLPVFWNGLVAPLSSRRSLGMEGHEMPIGTIMAEAHGRVHVSNSFNQIVSSDVMFGNGFTNSENVQKFTENTYPNEGGYFTFPARLGILSGMIVVPFMGNLRGQSELIAVGTNGGMSFDVSQPRLTWKDTGIQKTATTGRGCLAPYSLINVNGDPWFRSEDGWSSYLNTRLDLQQRVALRKFSREVNVWLDTETPHLIRYTSFIYHNNRIIGTVSPQLETANNGSSHRYFRGLLSLDLDHASGLAGGEVINFDGLWTGIRPTALVRVKTRALAFSFDADGQNRVYEICKQCGNDNDAKKIKSFYVTRRMTSKPSGSSEFQTKRVTAGELFVSEIGDRITAKVSHRPDNSPCWNPWETRQHGCDTPTGALPFSKSRHKRFKLGTPDPDTCEVGSNNNPSSVGTQHQYLVELEGNVRVNRFRVQSKVLEDPASIQGDCDDEDDESCEPIVCKSENDYEYLIVENG